jgi:hypothetical protein
MFGIELREDGPIASGMTAREAQLQRLAGRLSARPDVANAFTAKHFTDRLFVLEIEASATIPEDLTELLRDHDLPPASEVYGDGETQVAFAGSGDRQQYRFVDTQSRGRPQSLV